MHILSPLSILFMFFVNVLYQLKEVPSISGYLVFVFDHEYFFYINCYGSIDFSCLTCLVMDYLKCLV